MPCALVVLLRCAFLTPGPAGRQDPAHQFYHDGFKWSDDIVSGVRSVLGKDDDLRIEYMDARRISPGIPPQPAGVFRIKSGSSVRRGHRFRRPALDLYWTGEDLFPPRPSCSAGSRFLGREVDGENPVHGGFEEIDIKAPWIGPRAASDAVRVIAPVNPT